MVEPSRGMAGASGGFPWRSPEQIMRRAPNIRKEGVISRLFRIILFFQKREKFERKISTRAKCTMEFLQLSGDDYPFNPQKRFSF